LWSAIDAHESYLDAQHLRAAGERERLGREIVGLVSERVGRELRAGLVHDPELGGLLDEVVARRLDPHTAADRLYRERRR
ncbi:MAG TPA: hypothetical protein VIZ68_06200, partial [Thermoplasmata archaeon]